MGEAQRSELAASIMCITIEGHPLSVHNVCLIAVQRPNATVLGGFQQWYRAGRQVRKGERGLMIWAPTKPKEQKTDTNEEDARDFRFVHVTVFDITQTDEINREKTGE